MKKIKIVLIVVLIINVLAFVYLAFFLENAKEVSEEEYLDTLGYYNIISEKEVKQAQEKETTPKKEEVKTIYFENIDYLAEKYTGKVPLTYLSKEVTLLVEKNFKEIYTNTKSLNEEKIKEYFNNNKQSIAEIIGIIEESDFINLVNGLKIYSNENLEYKTMKIVQDTFNQDEKYANFRIQIEYTNGEKLEFNTYFSNTDNSEKPLVMLIPVKGGSN